MFVVHTFLYHQLTMCLTGVVHNHTSHVEEDAHNPQNTHVYVSTYRAWSTNPGLSEEVDNHCR